LNIEIKRGKKKQTIPIPTAALAKAIVAALAPIVSRF
jgi:hypothetical protein